MKHFLIGLSVVITHTIFFILGLALGCESKTIEALNNSSNTLTTLATLATVVIAYFGLYTWKEEFYYTRRFDAFNDLEIKAKVCLSELKKVLHNNQKIYADANNCIDKDVSEEKLKKASDEHLTSEQYACSLLSKKKQRNINHLILKILRL
uniref:hypothetical protein n=1 Tax=Photobacterium leiognathi TaxID=553611 RepID=UPI003B968DFF